MLIIKRLLISQFSETGSKQSGVAPPSRHILCSNWSFDRRYQNLHYSFSLFSKLYSDDNLIKTMTLLLAAGIFGMNLRSYLEEHVVCL